MHPDDKRLILLAMEFAGMEQMSMENAAPAGGLATARRKLLAACAKKVGGMRRGWWNCEEFREYMGRLCDIDGHRESKVFAGTLCGRCGIWLERNDKHGRNAS